MTDSMTCRNGLNSGAGPFRLALAGRPKQPDVLAGQLVLEAPAEVVLVADQRLSRPGGGQARFGGEQVQQGLALVGLGPGQGESDGQAPEGAHQVQAQAPEEAAAAGAVPVLGPSGQVGAFHGLEGASALYRRGIHDPHVVAPHGGVGGQ
ncbi:hypothetical protein GCM10010313_27080 [Streptomyces violarus]|nr:hypothetical protein GCM10010313_27080 [Streptomyces violarus]